MAALLSANNVLEQPTSLAYHCIENKLFATGSDTETGILEINPNTGLVTVQAFIRPDEGNELAIDQANNLLFVLGEDLKNLITVVRTSNFVPDNPILKNGETFDNIVYSCYENSLYSSNGSQVQRINLSDNSVSPVIDIPNLQEAVEGTKTFNQADGIYLFIGVDNNDNQRIYSVEVGSSNFGVTEPLQEVLSNLVFANACNVTADFTFDNLCSDSPVNFINNSIADRYQWNFGDPDSGEENTSDLESPSHLFSNPGTYTVELMARSCVDSDQSTLDIEIVEPPEFLLETIYEKCRIDEVTLVASNDQVESYEWSTGATTDSITVGDAGFYFVDATVGDCVKRYETEVADMPCPCSPDVPNAFTPNSDNRNDTFRPAFVEDYCEVLVFSMKIFNRWGQLVYETDDAFQPWDGMHNGNPAPSDVYVWTIEFSYIDKDTGEQGELEARKGDVALLR